MSDWHLTAQGQSTGRAEEVPLMLSDKNWEMGKRQETHFFHKKMEPKNTRIGGRSFGRIDVVLWQQV